MGQTESHAWTDLSNCTLCTNGRRVDKFQGTTFRQMIETKEPRLLGAAAMRRGMSQPDPKLESSWTLNSTPETQPRSKKAVLPEPDQEINPDTDRKANKLGMPSGGAKNDGLVVGPDGQHISLAEMKQMYLEKGMASSKKLMELKKKGSRRTKPDDPLSAVQHLKVIHCKRCNTPYHFHKTLCDFCEVSLIAPSVHDDGYNDPDIVRPINTEEPEKAVSHPLGNHGVHIGSVEKRTRTLINAGRSRSTPSADTNRSKTSGPLRKVQSSRTTSGR